MPNSKGLRLLGQVFALAALAGCQSIENVLSGVDYGCADIEIDGYFTDSRADGRAVKVPDDQELTPELVAALCAP